MLICYSIYSRANNATFGSFIEHAHISKSAKVYSFDSLQIGLIAFAYPQKHVTLRPESGTDMA
jgi:hypothetical protein